MDDITFKTDMAFAYGEPAPMGPGIVRVVAPNPSLFTFKGTNTYIVGSTSVAIIDPGPDDPAHLDAIMSAVGGREVSHILVTHAHRDHVDGVAALKQRTGAIVAGYQRDVSDGAAGPQVSPSGTDFIDLSFAPDLNLAGGDVITAADWSLTAIYTPGHAPDHLSFALDGRNILFSGDHVMAWNTTVIAPPEGRMSDYVRSLEILLDRTDIVFLPGHGGRLYYPQRTVKAFLLHRRWREQAILKAMTSGARNVRAIVPRVYKGLDPRMVPAAALSVMAHIEFLVEKGQAALDGPLSVDCVVTVV